MPTLNSAALTVEIVINAPPATVRAVYLDFDRLPQWRNKQKLFNTVAVQRGSDGAAIPGTEAQPGDIVKINSVQVGEVEAEVYVNTTSVFGYKGTPYGMLARHFIQFLPIPTDPNKTLLKHCETWEGGLSFMFWSYSPARSWLARLFAEFNEDMKMAAEG